ncbi:hypothetical protein LCGC14_1389980 [marine sediment metagenome]|uniref:Uncharacterized protein n=1 Tax=marine sediment metagenome TaxID=412755 RepID=A0A0F9KL30_9ZZZZ
MNITLKDIERAEQIIEAYRSGDMESLSANDIQFVTQPMLPALLKLVREMYEHVKYLSERGCWYHNKPWCACGGCEARRLVEQME